MADFRPLTLDSAGNMAQLQSGDRLVVPSLVGNAGDVVVDDTRLMIGTGTGVRVCGIDGGAGAARAFQVLTNGILRWNILGNADAESGTALGTNLDFDAYSNVGTLVGRALRLNRETLLAEFGGKIHIADTTDSTSPTSVSALKVDGGGSFAKAVNALKFGAINTVNGQYSFLTMDNPSSSSAAAASVRLQSNGQGGNFSVYHTGFTTTTQFAGRFGLTTDSALSNGMFFYTGAGTIEFYAAGLTSSLSVQTNSVLVPSGKTLNCQSKITAAAAVPGSFASLAAVQSYLASILN